MTNLTIQIEEINELIKEILEVIIKAMKSNIYEGLKIDNVLIKSFNEKHSLANNITFNFSKKTLEIKGLFLKCQPKELLLIDSLMSLKITECTINKSITIFSKKNSNDKNSDIYFENCSFREDLVINGNGHNIVLIGSGFNNKNIFLRNLSKSITLSGNSDINSINITEALGSYSFLNANTSKSLNITQYTDLDINLQILDSNIENIDISSSCKGDVFISDTQSSLVTLALPNADLGVQNSEIEEKLSINKGTEIRLSNIHSLRICELLNIEHTSFVDIVNISFSIDKANCHLIFKNSILQNCLLRNINLINTEIIFENSTNHTIHPYNIIWEDARAITTNTSKIDLYRNFKNVYISMNDSKYSEYFFNKERELYIIESSLDLIKGKGICDFIVLKFNDITGNGFNFLVPLLYVFILTTIMTAFYCNNFNKDFGNWLIPFQKIDSHNGDTLRLFIYLIVSIINTSCLFQAIQGFRKFNKRF